MKKTRLRGGVSSNAGTYRRQQTTTWQPQFGSRLKLYMPPVYALGNRAGDLDSIVAAIGCAEYLRTAMGLDARACAPFARSKLRLRKDAVRLFELTEFDANSMLSYVDELQLDKVDVVLVDHNAPDSEERPRRVLGVVDHHHRSSDEWKNEQQEPLSFEVIDEACGSTCSLLVSGMPIAWSPSAKVSKMLWATILVDTRNLDSKQLKFNQVDWNALEKLETAASTSVDGVGGGGVVVDASQRSRTFSELWACRSNVEGFSMGDLMELDFKRPSKLLGVSGMFTDLETFLAAEDVLLEFVEPFCLSENIDSWAGMFMKNENFKELAVFSAKMDFDSLSSNADSIAIQDFSNNQLFKRQKILKQGFHLKLDRKLSPRLATYTFDKIVSRKTLMPVLLRVLQQAA